MKSPIEKFIKELKQMHPIYALYMMQRIQADLEEIRNAIPALYEEERKEREENSNTINLIHPNFYLTYGKMMSRILNDILDVEIKEFVEPSVFEDTKNEQQ
jgi:hypothetical protein